MSKRMSRPFLLLAGVVTVVAGRLASRTAVDAQQQTGVVAIVGATIIDGNGGAPLSNATIVVRDKRIAEIGPRGSVTVPQGATVIDGAGKFITPGFIDTNVHISMYANLETLARYLPRATDVVVEGAQLELKSGITTVRDSYGELTTLLKVRDMVARGDVVGSRMLVAGNIVGWGGPFSITFS